MKLLGEDFTGGFFRRMREDEGTWLGHVLEHVAIELQNIAGESVTFGKTRSASAPGVYTVVYEYAQRDEGIAHYRRELAARPTDFALATNLGALLQDACDIDGAIEVGTEILPEKVIAKGAGKGVGNFIVDLLKTEIPGEQLATLGQDFNQWAVS